MTTQPDNPAVNLDRGETQRVADQLRSDGIDLEWAIGSARIRLYGRVGASTAPTIGVHERSPFRAVMDFHNAAFDQVVATTSTAAKHAQAMGGYTETALESMSMTDVFAGAQLARVQEWQRGEGE